MNAALWRKTIIEARLLLICSTLLLFTFHWVFVWLSSFISLKGMREFLLTLPIEWQDISGVGVDEVATVMGRIGLAFIDPVVMAVTAIWAIARGSDVISGEIDRGTMEMVLAQPVRRAWVLVAQALVTSGGAAILALACWLGTWAGIATVTLEDDVSSTAFVAPALNLFALTFFVCGVATLASSFDQYRWRTVGIVGGFYMVNMIIKVVARMGPDLDWLRKFTFFGAFEPQVLAGPFGESAGTLLQYGGLLVGLGLVCYVAAGVVFCRRDIPAPL